MKKMVDICKEDNQKIAFTLSDLFCVDRHRDSFSVLIKNDIDILFGNEDEICSMANSKSLNDGIEYAKSLDITVALTLSERGSLIIKNSEVIQIPAIDVDKVIDTTGAGDLFASGFLYGLCQNKELKSCGNMASIAAAEIISHYGARPLQKLSNLV